MLKQFTGSLPETREAYLVKRRSFPNSFGCFRFYVSRTTYEEDGIGAPSYRSHEIGTGTEVVWSMQCLEQGIDPHSMKQDHSPHPREKTNLFYVLEQQGLFSLYFLG